MEYPLAVKVVVVDWRWTARAAMLKGLVKGQMHYNLLTLMDKHNHHCHVSSV